MILKKEDNIHVILILGSRNSGLSFIISVLVVRNLARLTSPPGIFTLAVYLNTYMYYLVLEKFGLLGRNQ